MNIKYGDDNYLVRYLQAFLQEYYNKSFRVSGVYDEYTHSNLIEYLNMYNVASSDKLRSKLIEDYPELFLYFIYKSGSDIEFVSKSTSNETKEYMNSIKDSLTEYVTYLGWNLVSFIDYTTNEYSKFSIKLSAEDRINKFPNRDLLCMVNLFMNTYIYDYSINDTGNGNGSILSTTSDTKYKLAIVKDCDPDTYYTICHAYEGIINMTIASSKYDYNQDLTVNNVVSNVESFYLDGKSLYSYKTSSDCKTIVIQLQYGGLSADNYNVSVQIKTGDINLDGVIDSSDVTLLQNYVSSLGTADEFELDLPQKYAACIDRSEHPAIDIENREITQADVNMLNNYVNGVISSLPRPLTYTYTVESNEVSENVIMVAKGHYEDNDELGFKAETYFPSPSYFDEQWMVNDKLLNYILDRAITPYSDEEDIIYLQDLLYQLDMNNTFSQVGVYTDDMIELVRKYQIYYGVPFHTGYLDVQTEMLMLDDIYNISSTGESKYETVYLSSGANYIIAGPGVIDGDYNYIAVERIDVR